MNFRKSSLDLLNQSTPASFPPLPSPVFNMNHTAERFYVKYFLILHFFLSCSGSNEESSKTNLELLQPREMQTYINGSLIFKKPSCIMASTKNIFSHLITTSFIQMQTVFTSLLSTKEPKRVLLLIRTYPFF